MVMIAPMARMVAIAVEDNGDGTATIVCTDGTRTVIGINVDPGQDLPAATAVVALEALRIC